MPSQVGMNGPGRIRTYDQPEIKSLQEGHGIKLCYSGLLTLGLKALLLGCAGPD